MSTATKQNQPFKVPAKREKEIDEVISHYPEKRSASLMVLHAIQDEFGYIAPEAMQWVAKKLEMQPIHVYELVTFYPMFREHAAGRHVIKVCRTLSCALGGSHRLHKHFCDKLGLNPEDTGPQTTQDGKFTLEYSECLAACGTAPVMMMNDDFYESVSEERADEILSECG